MPATQRAIEDSIKGGWERYAWEDCTLEAGIIEKSLLDPTFWAAIGKSRGWDKKPFNNPSWPTKKGWEGMWYIFIFFLIEGLTIEEALLAIE